LKQVNETTDNEYYHFDEVEVKPYSASQKNVLPLRWKKWI